MKKRIKLIEVKPNSRIITIRISVVDRRFPIPCTSGSCYRSWQRAVTTAGQVTAVCMTGAILAANPAGAAACAALNVIMVNAAQGNFDACIDALEE